MTDKGRVIIADDHGLFRRGLRQLLEGEGYVVVAEVTSGDEALKSVAENPGCVLLLDITMPGMNGLEVVHRLAAVSYTHLRAHETDSYLVCRLLLEKKKKKRQT